MKALVIGAGGQLGRALLATAPAGVDVVGLDRAALDIGDDNAVGAAIARAAPDLVINAAAYTAVDKAESDVEAAYAVNTDGPRQIADVAARREIRFVHVSTDFVFDGTASTPYRPGDTTNPLSVYGASKLAGEGAVLGIDPKALIVRTAWVYAASGRNFLETMLRLMAEREELRVVADQIGTPTHAVSLARALWAMAATDDAGVVHWTDAGAASWYDFAVAIAEEAAALDIIPREPRIVPIATADYPTPARRPAFSLLDKTEGWSLSGGPARHWRAELRDALKISNGDILMAKLLVTGGAGFIGVNFVRYWRREHPADEVVVLDALTYAGNAASLEGVDGAELIHGNILDHDLVLKLLRERGIDTLVHFAAESHVDRSLSGPDAFIETNVTGTLSLLKAAKSAWLDDGSGKPHRFHHISTDEVYGTLGPSDPAFREDTAYAPNSPYAASKASSDHLVRAYNKSFGLETTTTNCSNNYGPYQFPEKLIPLFILNALHGRNLPIYGDGQQVRDWLYVEDHCRGIEATLFKGRPGETYNIGGGAELPNLQVIETLCAAVDAAFEADPTLATRYPDAPAAKGKPTASLKTHVTDRPGHDRRYAIDETKARGELGYEAAHGFQEHFASTLSWYLANEPWWQAILSGAYRDWIKDHYG